MSNTLSVSSFSIDDSTAVPNWVEFDSTSSQLTLTIPELYEPTTLSFNIISEITDSSSTTKTFTKPIVLEILATPGYTDSNVVQEEPLYVD